MPRNRKRAKERRARRPANPGTRPGLATAPDEGAPNPIAHATPDVELVDAQLAAGRPEPLDEDPELEAELEAEAEASAAPLGGGGDGRRGDGGSIGGGGGSRGGGSGGGEVAVPAGAPGAEVRVGLLARLIAFLQGSWRELQRVQWPDRRQVVQATSVVLGFVVVAGLFLALADLLAGHVVTFILSGHW